MTERSIANEVQERVKERRPFSILRFIRNEYFLYGVSLVLFLSSGT